MSENNVRKRVKLHGSVQPSRPLEAEGFCHGTQGLSADPVRAQLGAHFRQMAHAVRARFVDRIKRLEGRVETIARFFGYAQSRWQAFLAQTNGIPPQMMLPIMAIVLGAAALWGETTLLAPVMDGLGITDPSLQVWTAVMLVLVCAVLADMTFRAWQASTAMQSRPAGRRQNSGGQEARSLQRAATVGLTVLAFALLAILGWWRAEALIFGAKLTGGASAAFLAANPRLTRFVVTLITLAAPIVVAAAVNWGLDRFHYAWQWRKARREFLGYGRKRDRAVKLLEAEKEKLECELGEIAEAHQQADQAYVEHHQLGDLVGAVQQPLWQVLLKIGAVGPLMLAVCVLIDPWLVSYLPANRWLLYALLTLGLGGLYSSRAITAWDRPTSLQLYRQRATIWRYAPAREPVVRRTPVMLPQTSLLMLLAFVVILGLSCCTRTPRIQRPVELIVIPDFSASVTEEGRSASIEAVREAIKMLERGDSLTVIPITGDAQAEVLGKILRFELSRERQAWDDDIPKFRERVKADLDELARMEKYDDTDLLGTSRFVHEELSREKSGHHVVVWLTDFIHDVPGFDFKTDPRLATEESASVLAERLTGRRDERLDGVIVYLGSVVSQDLQDLNRERRQAIRVFWTELFTRQGAEVEWATDGPGRLPQLLKKLNQRRSGETPGRFPLDRDVSVLKEALR